MRELISRILAEMQSENDTVLATIVDASGSVPRSTGSQMLVGKTGLLCGTIGGGAIEKTSVDHALMLLREKRSDLREFALHADEQKGIGMICGGDAAVQYQYISHADDGWKTLLVILSERIEKMLPTQLVLYFDGGLPSVLDDSGALLCGSGVRTDAGRYIHRFRFPHRAVVFGAGHIAGALCPLLKAVDFRPVIYDDRPEYAEAKRFPDAAEVICGDFREIEKHLTMQSDDFVVIMTSGHANDFDVELQMHGQALAYLGVVGSRSKRAAVREKLKEQGVSDMQLDTVHTPIGLSIRAVTPSEIAVSIVSEMILVRAERRAADNGDGPVTCPLKSD